MKIVDNIDPNIFRGYDIRGVYGKDLNEDAAYTIGKSFGTYVQQKTNKKFAVIGRDNRVSSEPLSEALIQGILETGLDVINLGLVTTPMYYYSWILFEATASVMVTASHNPKEYNGFKFAYNERGNACGEMIEQFRDFTAECNFIDGQGKERHEDIRERYLKLLNECVKLGDRKIKMVVDCGNGTGSIIAKEAYEMIGAEVIPICCESDPDFPNHHPDPSVEKNMEMLKETVLSNHADIGIGIDGDADRIGIIDEKGNMIFADKMMIIIWRDIMSKVSNKRALFDIKCSKALPDEIEKLGGEPVFYRTGNSYVKAKIKDENFAFGGELSGHLFFNDKFPGFDDGIYAGMRFIEILSNTSKGFSELLDGINNYYSTPEIKIKSTDEEKFGIIEKIKRYTEEKGYKTITLDGVRAEFEDGWALVRASNTGPDITARFEAKTEERLKELEEEFMNLLK